MHGSGIVHFDLKPANILVQKKNGILIPKLGDFGLANIIDSTSLGVFFFPVHNTKGLTKPYAAPEQLNPKLINKIKHQKNITQIYFAADTYSMGIIINEIIDHQYPWNKK